MMKKKIVRKYQNKLHAYNYITSIKKMDPILIFLYISLIVCIILLLGTVGPLIYGMYVYSRRPRPTVPPNITYITENELETIKTFEK